MVYVIGCCCSRCGHVHCFISFPAHWVGVTVAVVLLVLEESVWFVGLPRGLTESSGRFMFVPFMFCVLFTFFVYLVGSFWWRLLRRSSDSRTLFVASHYPEGWMPLVLVPAWRYCIV